MSEDIVADENVALDPRADGKAPLAATNKAIILFSDGTGNSSGKLFKTNVFRLYQALDLGPSPGGHTTQVAYYDNGVGTSSIKLLAILGGIFGFGLKRNVLQLYRFLCRNYNEGDTIHAFGFSRGSFTIRLLIGLICSQGIVPYEDERELHYNSADAFYRFTNANGPDVFTWFWSAIRWTRDLLRTTWRKLRRRPMDVPGKWHPDIDFVGVWDTVAAYGGPISEITRGIDKYVWPLTMTDYVLHTKVKVARHALALDDERDSFWPLLWDEVAEYRRANNPALQPEERAHFATRLKQVWFAGMHSDVGGGYPDDSLAYVSLVWMLDEIGTGLRFNAEEDRRIRSFANAFGPMHDSRKGLAAYYRYQPRKIAALLHKSVDDTLDYDQTRILRDPTIGEKQYRPQGLLLSCHLHESVIARIGAGTDNYAPIVLPRDFTVTLPRSVKPAQPVSSEADSTLHVSTTIDQQILDRLVEHAAARGETQENAYDDVWRRRVGYFTTVALSLILLASPLFADRISVTPAADSRWVPDIIIRWFAPFVPGFATPWFQAFQQIYPLFFAVLALIWVVQFRSTGQEQRLRDHVRVAWWQAIAGQKPSHTETTRLRRFRNSFAYQFILQQLKWRLVPFLVGVMLLLLMPYALAIIAAQVRMAVEERGEKLCQRTKPGAPIDNPVWVMDFAAEEPCHYTQAIVGKGRHYRVYITTATGWRDGQYEVPAKGLAGRDFPWFLGKPVMMLTAPFKRVVPARYLEPLVEIRGENGLPAILRLEPLEPDSKDAGNSYAGEFTAPYDGSLHLFLNDVIGPWGALDYSYRGSVWTRNGGTAAICIEDTDIAITDSDKGCPQPGPSSGERQKAIGVRPSRDFVAKDHPAPREDRQ